MSAPATLRRALALRFALAALVPLVGAALLVLRLLAVESVDGIGERNQLLARAVRAQIDGFLREPVVTLRSLREVLAVTRGASTPELERLLDAAVHSSSLLESIYLVGPDGSVKAVGIGTESGAFRQDFIGLNLSHQPVIRKAFATGQLSWSETFPSILTGRMSLAICLPLGNDLLLGSFNIGQLQQFTRRIQHGSPMRVSILDRGGSVLAHSDPGVELNQVKLNHLQLVRRGFSGEEATSRFEFLGKDSIASVVRTQDAGWLVLVSQSAETAFRPVRLAAYAFFTALLFAIAMVVLFALTQSRRISDPLEKLAALTQEVAGGGYEFLPAPSGSPEVQKLAESFRLMTEAVRDRERLLRAEEEKYRLLVHNAGDAIFVSREGRLLFVNRRTEEITGVGADILLSTPWVDRVHPEHRAQLLERERTQLAGGQVTATAAFKVVRPDGEERWVQMNSVPLDWSGRPAILNFARDITALRSLEAQALQAQKMEAVGTLAGGVAHDFNNLLQAIQGSAELALIAGRDPASNRRALEQIVRSAERGADLTRQLLMFSRKIESRRIVLDLNKEVEEVARLLGHTLPKMISVELDLDRGLRAVNADPGQIQQVLVNLAVNAGQAMAGSGTLRIATANLDLEARDDARPEIAPGHYVEIAVSDTGVGIEERNRQRIFEPFFTTKGPGEGTGLGLSMVFGIVKEHEGHIFVESAPGEGTTFRIVLPSTDTPRAVASGAAFAAPAPPAGAGGEGVLIVDDEETVRSVGAEILSSQGYRVLTAPDGETALRLYARERSGIDLVLLDMIMPGMGGKKCLQELLAMDPAVRVVVASGYSPEGTGETMASTGARGFISKPFRAQTLLATIRKVLGDAS